MKPGDEESLRVSGTFPSKGGAGALFVMVPTEDFDEDDVAENHRVDQIGRTLRVPQQRAQRVCIPQSA